MDLAAIPMTIVGIVKINPIKETIPTNFTEQGTLITVYRQKKDHRLRWSFFMTLIGVIKLYPYILLYEYRF